MFYTFQIICVLRLEIMCNVNSSITSKCVSIPVQGLPWASMVCGHNMCFVGVTVGLVGVS